MIDKLIESKGCRISQIKLFRYFWVMNVDTCPGCGGFILDCPSYDISGAIKPKPEWGLESIITIPGGVFYYIRNNPHDLAEGIVQAGLAEFETVAMLRVNLEEMFK